MGSYFYEKSKMYYEKYKAGKLTKKVGSIVKDGNKYLTILRTGKRPIFATLTEKLLWSNPYGIC